MHFFSKALLLVIAIATVSCSLIKDSEPDNQPNKDSYQIRSSKYYFSDKTFGEINYIYDSANKLVQKKWYNPENEVDFHENFEYNNNQLIRIDRSIHTGEFAEARFMYTNGLLKTAEYWVEETAGNLQKLHVTDYEYVNGQVAKTITTYYNNEPASYSIYTYENGNITTIKSYALATNQLLEENTFTYDTYTNLFYKMSSLYVGSPITSSKNNVLRHQTRSFKQNAQNSDLSYQYTYNEKGYPTEKYLLGQENKKFLDESYSYIE